MLIAGIDEAGRGPVLGPLVLAVATIEKKDEESLKTLGVKDSKMLSPKERERLFAEIQKMAVAYATNHIAAHEIDSLRDHKSLNEIEAMRAAQLLNGLKQKPELAIVDSPDTIQGNFAKRIRQYISFDCVIQAEHKADVNYPIVSAASIIAKVERDAAIALLAKEHGPMGSGYPHDEETIAFVEKWLNDNGKLPPFARKSWNTAQRLMDKQFQKKLF